MSKVALIQDSYDYAATIAAFCATEGHATFTATLPDAFDKLVAFDPDVLVLGLYRQPRAYDRPIGDWEQDVAGLKLATELNRRAALQAKPVLILGLGLEEAALPEWLPCDLFLQFPTDMRVFLTKLEELATTVRTRRRPSAYACPHCGSRLAFAGRGDDELVCARCLTTVSRGRGDDASRFRVGGTELTGTCSLAAMARRHHGEPANAP